MKRIAITDDHPIVIEGLKNVLDSEPGYQVVATYSNLEATRKGLQEAKADLLLLDINLPDGNGAKICPELIKERPSTQIIGLTNLEDTAFIKLMLRNGARGYLLKNTRKEELIQAMDTVLSGEIYLPEKIKKLLVNESLGKVQSHFIPKLTRREKEVLDLILSEYTTQEIAEKLFISTKTVESHRTNLLQKTGTRNTAGLVRIALEKGL